MPRNPFCWIAGHSTEIVRFDRQNSTSFPAAIRYNRHKVRTGLVSLRARQGRGAASLETETAVFYWDVALLLYGITLLPWLWATARLAGHPVRWWRILLATLVGSIAAALWEWLSVGAHLSFTLIGTLLLLQFAFGPLRPAHLVRSFLLFTVIGATGAGLSFLVLWQTGIKSFEVAVFIGLCLLAGAGPMLWAELTTRANNAAHRWRVRLEVGGKSLCLDGLVDTGHQLRAPVTGQPVLLVATADLAPLLGVGVAERLAGPMIEWDQLPALWRGRVRSIPYRTVAGEGLLPAFRPDGIWLQRGETPWQRVEALIGMAAFGVGGRGDYQVLLPPLLLESLREPFSWEVERR